MVWGMGSGHCFFVEFHESDPLPGHDLGTGTKGVVRHYGDRKQEHFLCVSINAANEVINVRVVTVGLIDRSHVHPREVFADVISERASAVVIAHNHPVGDLHPSPEDREVTARIKEAGKVLGINLLDHIIFNHKDYYSFLENDQL